MFSWSTASLIKAARTQCLAAGSFRACKAAACKVISESLESPLPGSFYSSSGVATDDGIPLPFSADCRAADRRHYHPWPWRQAEEPRSNPRAGFQLHCARFDASTLSPVQLGIRRTSVPGIARLDTLGWRGVLPGHRRAWAADAAALGSCCPDVDCRVFTDPRAR